MAQPANIFTTNDMVGIREDLADVIYDVSPSETPFYSSVSKVKAASTLHEWQTDALRAPRDNKNVQGDDTVALARTPTVRLNNQTQIFKDAVVTSGTQSAVTKAGRGDDQDYQMMKVAKEQKLDIEYALFANNAKVAGTDSVAGELAGLGSWVTTNTSIGSGGSDPAGTGANARTDGTQRALTQTFFDTVMQDCWTSGGRPTKVFLSPFQMNLALGFVGNNNQRNTVAANRVSKTMDVYVTPWGTVEFMPVRPDLIRSRDLFIMEMDKWAVAVLRPTFKEGLAKSGDSTKEHIITELTLECRNEKASGGVFDLTTS